jgi:hypothetical protein
LAASAPAQPQKVPGPPVDPVPLLAPEEAQALAPYLTKDFTLTAAIEVHNELTGFGTFFGTVWRVEPNGEWTITRIYQTKPYLIGKGKLPKIKILDLARKLYAYDPLSLPNVGKPIVNPHVVTVAFGPKTSVLTFGVDQKLPPTALDNLVQPVTPGGPYVVGNLPTTKVIPPLDPLTRYAGMEWALRGLIQPNLGVIVSVPERLKQMGHPD